MIWNIVVFWGEIRMNKFKYALLCGLLAIPALARADVSTKTPSQQIDFAQLQAKLQEISDEEFNKLDTDKDGNISQEEYIEYMVQETRKKSAKSFSQLDTNKDGKISKDEYNEFVNQATGQMGKFLKMMQDQVQK